jgi:hypothetical protein
MSDPKPNLEGPSPTGSPVVNEARLDIRDSQTGNAAQVVNSPGAVVTQVQIDQGSSAVPGILAGMFGVLLLLLVGVLPLLGKLVPSGLAVCLVGLSSALIVGAFFVWVESLLRSTTKSEIAGWLVGVHVGQKVEPWPDTFAKVFDRVFGQNHLSWICFWRSTIFSFSLYFLMLIVTVPPLPTGQPLFQSWAPLVLSGIIGNVVPDYFSLLGTRIVLGLARRLEAVHPE